MRAIAFAAVSLFAVAASAQSPAPAKTLAPDAAARCEAMADQQIRPGVTIQKTTAVAEIPAGTAMEGGAPLAVALPAHCLLEGMIDPHQARDGTSYGIGFALALPQDWNGRFLLQGGGGMNGVVRPAIGPVAAGDRPALSRGFAVLSHDSGHKGAGFDQTFMTDQRAALDFAETAVRKVTEVGKGLTESYYGRSIGHAYFAGCSTGGREGMLAVQRYPEMFDGVIIGAPAMRPGFSNLAIEYSAVQFNQAAPRDAEGLPVVERIFSPADRKTILDGMLAQCDGLDGRADGMIMNVAQCQFRPAALQCTGAKQDGCLSGEQVGALERAFAGPNDAAGHPAYMPVPWDTGIVDTTGPLPGYLPTGAPGVFGPATRALEIDMDDRLVMLRADAVARLTDTHVWTDLDAFLGHGGKVLFFHGVSDPWFSAFDSWDYWQRAAETNGAAFTDASRYYMIPGMGHCGGGNAFDNFDLLGPLVDWVERGQTPDRPLSRRRDGSESRPLCPHPSYAHYDGGDPSKEESYSCRTPA